MTTKPCHECQAGPSGLEGHAQLAMQIPVTGQPHRHATFRCANCGSEWTRTYSGGGTFTWRQVDISSN